MLRYSSPFWIRRGVALGVGMVLATSAVMAQVGQLGQQGGLRGVPPQMRGSSTILTNTVTGQQIAVPAKYKIMPDQEPIGPLQNGGLQPQFVYNLMDQTGSASGGSASGGGGLSGGIGGLGGGLSGGLGGLGGGLGGLSGGIGGIGGLSGGIGGIGGLSGGIGGIGGIGGGLGGFGGGFGFAPFRTAGVSGFGGGFGGALGANGGGL